MKVHLNLDNFYENEFPYNTEEASNYFSNNLIPIGKSGIKIKEKNKGTFTSYCGGTVTDECIQRGKNSPSAAIRKKATFADNARHWKRKHQYGGTINLSDLFVESDTPPTFELNKMELPSLKYEDLEDEEVQTTTEDNTPDSASDYEIPEIVRTPRTTISSTSSSSTAEPTQSSNQELLSYIQPHLGKPYKVGNYDCSNFVSRVLKDMGHSNLYGNCRTLYNGTSRISMQDLKPGDLIFLKNTQKGKVKEGLASHVAIVTDTSRLNEGIVQIAHNGHMGGVSNITEWDLNNDFYKQHLLGAGRLPQLARFGGKLQFGGNLYLVGARAPHKITPDEVVPTFYYRGNFDGAVSRTNNPTVAEVAEYQIPGIIAQPRDVRTSELKSSAEKVSYFGTNYENFKALFENYLKSDPDAKKYEKVLTDIAKHESNFKYSIQNLSGAPAYGYFQFWQDGNINNITKYSGLSVEDFRNNPDAQIAAAVKMARSIENQFNSEDLRIAKAKGYTMDALIRGAWLGGVSGVRKVLRGTGNPSDRHWNSNGRGHSVKEAMDAQV